MPGGFDMGGGSVVSEPGQQSNLSPVEEAAGITIGTITAALTFALGNFGRGIIMGSIPVHVETITIEGTATRARTITFRTIVTPPPQPIITWMNFQRLIAAFWGVGEVEASNDVDLGSGGSLGGNKSGHIVHEASLATRTDVDVPNSGRVDGLPPGSIDFGFKANPAYTGRVDDVIDGKGSSGLTGTSPTTAIDNTTNNPGSIGTGTPGSGSAGPAPGVGANAPDANSQAE